MEWFKLRVLTDWPREARWLRPDERDWITARFDEERRAKAHAEQMTICQALRHPAVLVLTAGLFFTYTGGYAFWFWFPTMLQRFTGWTDVQRIGWVGAIPFVAGLIGMLFLGWNSDRTGERRWHFASSSTNCRARVHRVVLHPTFEYAPALRSFTLVGFGSRSPICRRFGRCLLHFSPVQPRPRP